MKAIAHRTYGTPDALEFVDLEPPEIDDDEVLIRVHAASINPLDWHVLTGTPYLVRLVAGLRRPKRIVRGVDVAGRIEAVGASVVDLAVGDRVFGAARGSFAEYAVASPRSIVATPATLTDAGAASLPVAAVTALQALRDHARLRPGQSVLINGAAGGVGTAMVQLAVAMGFEVTAVCSSRNADLVRELGAHHVVDYERDDFAVARSAYDAMIDNVGNRSITDCLAVLARDGTYVMVSGPKQGRWLGPVRRMLAARLRFALASQRFASFTAAETADELRELVGYVERGELRPVIDRIHPLADTASAVSYVATGHARAKVVIAVVDDIGDIDDIDDAGDELADDRTEDA